MVNETVADTLSLSEDALLLEAASVATSGTTGGGTAAAPALASRWRAGATFGAVAAIVAVLALMPSVLGPLALLARVGLREHVGTEAQTLSHGDQRILEVALALATEPRLLLLDEPTAGMSPMETDRMVDLVADLSSQGLTVLLSEHDMNVVFGVSDEVTVLHQGGVVAHGSPDQVQDDEHVIEVYLGGEA
jgi:excinuclease UvrABC ATPase subunit